MFKKIAHNSTIPSLAGNRDLRPLQDLITAEKFVLLSLQRLSVDCNKAAEALRAWGASEGDDLADTLQGSTNVLSHFSTALTQYAKHEENIRDRMKSVRTREEDLQDLKRRRRELHAKADAADKKLSRMSPEHKNLSVQTDILNKLKDDIQSIEMLILNEEAGVGDYKRRATREWMSLKFAGLVECCEHGSIVGKYGKLIIAEIPEDITQPGQSRVMYQGYPKVEAHTNDAYRAVGEVVFSGIPSSQLEFKQSAPSSESVPLSRPYPQNNNNMGPSPNVWSSGGDGPPSGPPPNYLGSQQGLGQGRFMGANDVPPPSASGEAGTFPLRGGPTQTGTIRSVDDFGVMGGAGAGRGAGVSGGRFATFPVKQTRGDQGHGYALHDNPVPRPPEGNAVPRHGPSDSFSSSIMAAMRSEDDTFSSSGHGHQSKPSEEFYVGGRKPPEDLVMGMYSPPPPGPPPFSARYPLDPWNDGAGEAQLAFASNPADQARTGGRAPEERHVRFGRVGDVDERMETSPINEYPRGRDESRSSAEEDRSPQAQAHTRASPPRLPPVSLNPEEEEHALNAAAAREVSREFDALNFSPPSAQPDADLGDSEFLPTSYGASPYSSQAAPPAPPPAPPPIQTSVRLSPSRPSPTGPRVPVAPSVSTDSTLSYPTSPPAPAPYSTPVSSISLPKNPSPHRTQPPSPTIDKSTSPSNSAAPVPPSTKTITAAAFKRPQGRPTLPSSPYPPLQPKGSSAGQGQSGAPPRGDMQDTSEASVEGSDDQFDYIAAYVNSMGIGDESKQSEKVESQKPNVGYGEGKFATNLEGDYGLR